MTEEKAREIAHGLIQGYIGPDHKVIDMNVALGILLIVLAFIFGAAGVRRRNRERQSSMVTVSDVLAFFCAAAGVYWLADGLSG
jgi:hypothetical protein